MGNPFINGLSDPGWKGWRRMGYSAATGVLGPVA